MIKQIMWSILSVAALTGCSHGIQSMKPDHVRVSPSVQWDCYVDEWSTHPKIEANLDWNL